MGFQMAIFDFTDDLKNGVNAMDREHQFLFDAINTAYDLLKTDKAKAYAYFQDVIVKYVETHLNHEEVLMKKYHYPEYEYHLKAHATFKKVILDLIPAIQAGDPKAFMEVYAISMGWLIGHIEKVDMKYGKWYKEQGLSDELNQEKPIGIS
jgi:hemerythrin-like metal-binding protein